MAVRCSLLSITILLFRRFSEGRGEGRGGGLLLHDPVAEMGQLGVGLGVLDTQALPVDETWGSAFWGRRIRGDSLDWETITLSTARRDSFRKPAIGRMP
jgi:hypothetical protein